MASMKIDFGKLMSAVSAGTEQDGRREKAFLNRNTGDIVFVSEDDPESWYGKIVAVEMVFDRAEVEANPSEWIEIPKYREWHRDTIEKSEAEERYAYQFLSEHGIDAKVV
jgi:hypothetical protein